MLVGLVAVAASECSKAAGKRQRGPMYENAFNAIERELRNEEGVSNELDYVE